MPSACAQAEIPTIGLIACRHNVTCVSMMPFSSAEIYAESMCYHRCAYAPQTRAEVSREQATEAIEAGKRFVAKMAAMIDAG